jgi:mono/diheme cytochrome c family protein
MVPPGVEAPDGTATLGRMRSRPVLLALAALTLTTAGCGGGEKASDTNLPGDTGKGKQVFASAGCAGCHTLRAANATGTKGPNLDTVGPGYQRVVEQVTKGSPAMPSFEFKLDKDQIRNVAAFVADSTGGGLEGQPLAGKFKPNDKKIEDCKGDFACFEQAYGNLAYYEGPKVALARFEQAIAKPGGAVEGNCHRIAHSIGAASLARFKGNVAPAFAAGTAACWSGYYHGVVERALVDVKPDEIPKAARGMCDDPDLRGGPTFTLYQCVHGLGHGLMIYTHYDMPRSLKVCDALNGSWDQTSCTGGVFMENLSSSYGVKSKWLKDNDLIYPCNAVAERHKIYCYLMVTSRILPVVGYDFAKAAKLCRKSEKAWIATCFQSLGRDASGHSRQNPDTILKYCSTGGSMMGDCIYGAARDMSSNYAGGEEASVLCKKAPKALRARCFEGIGTILGGLYPASEARRAACNKITTEYRAVCARGAGA